VFVSSIAGLRTIARRVACSLSSTSIGTSTFQNYILLPFRMNSIVISGAQDMVYSARPSSRVWSKLLKRYKGKLECFESLFVIKALVEEQPYEIGHGDVETHHTCCPHL
jgi:hypothetical protein